MKRFGCCILVDIFFYYVSTIVSASSTTCISNCLIPSDIYLTSPNYVNKCANEYNYCLWIKSPVTFRVLIFFIPSRCPGRHLCQPPSDSISLKVRFYFQFAFSLRFSHYILFSLTIKCVCRTTIYKRNNLLSMHKNVSSSLYAQNLTIDHRLLHFTISKILCW